MLFLLFWHICEGSEIRQTLEWLLWYRITLLVKWIKPFKSHKIQAVALHLAKSAANWLNWPWKEKKKTDWCGGGSPSGGKLLMTLTAASNLSWVRRLSSSTLTLSTSIVSRQDRQSTQKLETDNNVTQTHHRDMRSANKHYAKKLIYILGFMLAVHNNFRLWIQTFATIMRLTLVKLVSYCNVSIQDTPLTNPIFARNTAYISKLSTEKHITDDTYR